MASGRNLGTVLVTGWTGAQGWLSERILEALIADKSFNSFVSTVEPGQKRSNVPGVTYHECDLSDIHQFTKLLDTVKPRAIIHTVTADFFSKDSVHYNITYLLAKSLVEAARKHPSVQALVYTSTVEVHALHPSDNTHPVREDHPTYSLHSGPHAYARTKSAVDAFVRESNTPDALSNTTGNFSNQLLTAVLRTTGIYGPGDPRTIPALLKQVDTPNTKFQIGPNALVHNWLHVDNCANAHVLAVKALLDPRRGDGERADGQAFFLSDGKPIPFWDFVRTVWGEAGDANWAPNGPREVKRVIPFWLILFGVGAIEWAYWIFTLGRLQPRVSTLTYYYMRIGCWVDVGKARRVLGYEPMFGSVEEGVRQTIGWFRENGRLKQE